MEYARLMYSTDLELLGIQEEESKRSVIKDSEDMVDWAGLNHELLLLIAKRIEKLEDFASFGSVCTWWRSASTKKNFKGIRLRQKIPCLMLPTWDHDDIDRQFYSIQDNEITCTVSFPNFKGKRFLESLGWFLSSGKDGNKSLLHPFTSQEIQLPHQTTLINWDDGGGMSDGYMFVQKMVLSARPDETSDYIVMVICSGCSQLAFSKPGYEIWNPIKLWHCTYTDVTFYGGKFYAIDGKGFVVVCDPLAVSSYPMKAQILTRVIKNRKAGVRDEFLIYNDLYIVGSLGMLFVIIRIARGEEDCDFIYHTRKFRVIEIDISSGKWEEITSLGSRAIFLGHSATTVIDDASKLSGIKPNHIYFTEDGWESYYSREEGGGKDMGIYNLETGDIEWLRPHGQLLSRICTSIWVTPTF